MSNVVRTGQKIKLADNLRRIMAEKNLRVTGVARDIGMSKSTLHGYCNGVMPRNLEQLMALADRLEVSFVEMLFGTETGADPQILAGSVEGRYEITIRRIPEGTSK